MSILDQLLATKIAVLTQGASRAQLQQLLDMVPKLQQHAAVQIHIQSQPTSPGPARSSSRQSGRMTPDQRRAEIKGRRSGRSTPVNTGRTTPGGSRFSFLSPSSKNAWGPESSPPTSSPRTAHSPRSSSRRSNRPLSRHEEKHPERSGTDLISHFRQKLEARCGKDGIAGLGRVFRFMDKDRSGQVNAEELYHGLLRMGMPMSRTAVEELIIQFDRGGNGEVSYDELLRELRGALNEGRTALIRQAFDTFDKTGDGQVDIADLRECYDVSCHPEVKAGRMSPDQALTEFLNNFEIHGTGQRGEVEADGKITFDEFQEYYRWISSSIEDDAYFELMIRNAWHLSGGKGQAENTSNRRLLVVHLDGSEEVVSLDNDLGLGAHPSQQILKNILRRQGVTQVDRVVLTA